MNAARALVVAATLAAIVVVPAWTATNEYSTGNIRLAIAPGTTVERALSVPHKGPVSFVRASFRISVPQTADLSVALVSARGTVVPLVSQRGSGADFGSGSGCGGQLTVFENASYGSPIGRGSAPFVDNPYRPEGSLKALGGEQARGRWRLRIENAGDSAAALQCFVLDVSRAVPTKFVARQGDVTALLSGVETNFQWSKLHVTVNRAGKKLVDARAATLRGCRDCGTFRPTGVKVRDLDGGEPEVLVDMYTGGAHCCTVTLILRYDTKRTGYTSRLGYWGNYGYGLSDLDGDGRPELQAFDERFVYAFAAYVFSAAPIQIWQYRRGIFVDVTRKFPTRIAAQARELKATYEKERKNRGEVDVRGFVAAYVADLYLLGRGEEGQAFLRQALARGDLRGSEGWPEDRRFVTFLNRFLRKNGYIR